MPLSSGSVSARRIHILHGLLCTEGEGSMGPQNYATVLTLLDSEDVGNIILQNLGQ